MIGFSSSFLKYITLINFWQCKMKSLAKCVIEVKITLYENEKVGVSLQALANDMFTPTLLKETRKPVQNIQHNIL